MPTIISLRTACHGGDISAIPFCSQDLHGFNRLTLLIHGYNDSACDAQEAYEHFLNSADVGGRDVRAAFGEICQVYWPGDARVLGGASYPFEIPRARESAAMIGELLRDLARGRAAPLEVLFVCHSLGNRLLLEMLGGYLRRPPANIRVLGALLMAAAVMVSMVEDPQGLEPAAASAGNTRVLCSTHDPVLKWAFGFGEFAAGEGFGTAVGRRGDPSALWATRQPMEQYDSHGDYWQNADTGPQVKIWLGLPAAPPLPVAVPASETLPVAPVLADRSLPIRKIGDGAFSCTCPES